MALTLRNDRKTGRECDRIPMRIESMSLVSNEMGLASASVVPDLFELNTGELIDLLETVEACYNQGVVDRLVERIKHMIGMCNSPKGSLWQCIGSWHVTGTFPEDMTAVQIARLREALGREIGELIEEMPLLDTPYATLKIRRHRLELRWRQYREADRRLSALRAGENWDEPEEIPDWPDDGFDEPLLDADGDEDAPVDGTFSELTGVEDIDWNPEPVDWESFHLEDMSVQELLIRLQELCVNSLDEDDNWVETCEEIKAIESALKECLGETATGASFPWPKTPMNCIIYWHAYGRHFPEDLDSTEIVCLKETLWDQMSGLMEEEPPEGDNGAEDLWKYRHEMLQEQLRQLEDMQEHLIDWQEPEPVERDLPMDDE